MSYELITNPCKLKRGINEIKIKMKAHGCQYVANIFVGGTFRKKPIPSEIFWKIYYCMETAVGPGPYTIRAKSGSLAICDSARFPGKDILIYRGLFSGEAPFKRARQMWKAQFNYRAIEAWYPVTVDGEDLINYTCIWIGDGALEEE